AGRAAEGRGQAPSRPDRQEGATPPRGVPEIPVVKSAGRTARDRRLIAGLVRRAISTGVPLLAKGLDRYATAEGLSWEELARSLGGTPDDLNQVALCRPPRPECFVEDTQAIAA